MSSYATSIFLFSLFYALKHRLEVCAKHDCNIRFWRLFCQGCPNWVGRLGPWTCGVLGSLTNRRAGSITPSPPWPQMRLLLSGRSAMKSKAYQPFAWQAHLALNVPPLVSLCHVISAACSQPSCSLIVFSWLLQAAVQQRAFESGNSGIVFLRLAGACWWRTIGAAWWRGTRLRCIQRLWSASL